MANIEINHFIVTVVESSLTQGKIIINRLSRLGVEKVQYYPSVSLALPFIEKFSPHLVVSSMYLSDQTATDLILTMRASSAMESIPFMLITSEKDFDTLDPIRQAGVIAVLNKPFELRDLENALYATVDLLSVDEDFIDKFAWEDLNVLVVDDSPLAQKVVCKLLAGIGVSHIDLAINGKEAVSLLSENTYDLVVTDYNMPEMNGQELVSYIRKESNQPNVPVLMITSEKSKASLVAARDAGVSGICSKPFEPYEFKKQISRFFVNRD